MTPVIKNFKAIRSSWTWSFDQEFEKLKIIEINLFWSCLIKEYEEFQGFYTRINRVQSLLPPLLLSPPLLSVLSPPLVSVLSPLSLSGLSPSLLGPLCSLLSALSFSPISHDSLVKNSPPTLVIGAWYPGAFFCSSVGFLVKVTSMTVRYLSFSTLTSPSSLGIKTSTIFFSVMLMIWWSSGTFLLRTSATQRALSMSLSAALIVTNCLSSPKKRVKPLATYRPIFRHWITIGWRWLHDDVSLRLVLLLLFLRSNPVVFWSCWHINFYN